MFAKLATISLLAASVMGQATINTPASLIECQPALLSVSGGTTPYIIAALPGGQVSAAAIEYVVTGLTSTSYTWTVNLAAGTNITLRVTDATGAANYASPVVIQAGSSTSCLNSTASTSGLSTAAVTTTVASSGAASGAASSTSAAASSSGAASSSAAAASTSKAASSSASAAASSSAAASASASKSAAGAVAILPNVAVLSAVAAGLLGGVAYLL